MNFPPQSWDDNGMDWENAEFKVLNPYPLTYIAAIKEALRERYSALGRSTEFNQNITASLTPLSPVFEFIKALYQIEYAIYNLLQGYNKPEWVRLSTHNIYDGSTDVSGSNGMPCERLWFLYAMEDAGYGAGENWIGFFTSVSGFTLSQTQSYLDKKLYPISEVIDISKLGDWFRQKRALINLMRWSWSPYSDNRTFSRGIQTRNSTPLQDSWSAAKSAYLAQATRVYPVAEEMFNYSGHKNLNPDNGYIMQCQQSRLDILNSTIERTDEIYRYAHTAEYDFGGKIQKEVWKLTKRTESTTSQYVDIFPTDSDLSGASEPSTEYMGSDSNIWWDHSSGYSFLVQKFDGANGFKFRDW